MADPLQLPTVPNSLDELQSQIGEIAVKLNKIPYEQIGADLQHALGNLDPFSGAYVLSRGIVGTRKGEPTVASPLHKQVFSLVTGRCLDDESVSVPTYPVRVNAAGVVEVTLEAPGHEAPAMPGYAPVSLSASRVPASAASPSTSPPP